MEEFRSGSSVSPEPGITADGVTVEREGHVALTDITFDVKKGTLMGVLGPNGRREKHPV